MYRTPKIMKALSRAIAHEIRNPGEFAKFMEYQHLLAGSREVDKEEYKKTVLRRKTQRNGLGPKN